MKQVISDRWSRAWILVRWLVLVPALPALWACNARTLAPPVSQPNRVNNQIFQATLNRNLDILFEVDDSQSMLPLQAKLLAQFPVFMNVLKALPMGLPDIHVAVISQDTGVGKFDLTSQHCPYLGDQGKFQFQPRGTCTVAPIIAGQTFLSASNNQQNKNYTGDIADAFTCIAALGDGGCGLEGQLKSVRWALDPANVPPGNEGFLRPGAILAVIILTNEDDCSVPDDSDLGDPSQNLNSDPLGPLWSFRCNEFGHLCNINGTLQPPPRGPATDLQGCISNDTATGKLTRLTDEIAFLKGLKTDPTQLFVAAITAPATPYSIELIPGPGTGEQIANMVHSCTQNSGEYGDPSVRITQWVEAFGQQGLEETICAPSYAPALGSIATALSKLLGPQCLSGTFVDQDPTTPALDPECQVTDRILNDQGQRIETPLQACAVNGNTPPCWSIVDDPMKCPGAKILNVNRGTATPPSGLDTAVSCAMCISGVAEAGCPCVAGSPVPGCL